MQFRRKTRLRYAVYYQNLCVKPKMTIHNLYMFDRQGVLMYYAEWNRKRQSGMAIEEVCY